MTVYRRIAVSSIFGENPADTETEINIVLGDATEIKVKVKNGELEVEVDGGVVEGWELFGDLFFHTNRDGSVAVATGAAPDVWPEDDISSGDFI